MHLRHAVLVGCLAAGCASAGTPRGDSGSGDTALRQSADHVGNGIDVATVTATRTKLAFDAEIAFGVLPLVYDAIPIPVTTNTGADRTIAT